MGLTKRIFIDKDPAYDAERLAADLDNLVPLVTTRVRWWRICDISKAASDSLRTFRSPLPARPLIRL